MLIFGRPMLFANLLACTCSPSEIIYVLLEKKKAFKLLGAFPNTLFRWERIIGKRWIMK